ncbi:MTOR-associated protein MEAK7-like [Halyomorpha halys]
MLTLPMVLAFSHLVYANMKKDCWRLLYSSLTDAQSWNILSSNIAKQGPTIILIEDGVGSLFGGFASQSWKICPHFYGDECSFLFRLRPRMELYAPTGYNQNFQYMNQGAATLPNGLGMGGQLDYFTFYLNSDFGPVTVSKSCSTYRDYSPFAPVPEFNFSKLEIWGIGSPDVEEENVRVAGSIIYQDPGATAILEIAGKSLYSKDLKESLDKE